MTQVAAAYAATWYDMEVHTRARRAAHARWAKARHDHTLLSAPRPGRETAEATTTPPAEGPARSSYIPPPPPLQRHRGRSNVCRRSPV